MKRAASGEVKIRVKRPVKKPAGFEEHLSLSELCEKLGRDPSWIRKLESWGKIPTAHRVSMGSLRMRLWSPKQVDEIALILSRQRRGRPRRDG